MPRTRSYAAFLVFIGVTLLGSTPAAQTPRALSAHEMQAIRAGLSVSSFSTPTTNQRVFIDNPLIDFSFSSVFASSSLFVETRAGSSKIASAVVSVNAGGTGRFVTRANIPVGASFNPRVFYCNPPFTSCGNAALGAVVNNVRLDTQVQVNNIRFHNLSDGTEASAFPFAAAGRLADDLTFDRNLSSTPSIDKFFEQCSVASRVQLRQVIFDTLTVAKGCTRFDTDQAGAPCVGVQTQAQFRTFFDNLATNNGGNNDFHVFFVNDLNDEGGGTRGIHFPRANGTGTPAGYGPGRIGRNWVVVEDDLDANPGVDPRGTAVTVAHEYSHSRGLCHADQAGCTQAGNSNNCTITNTTADARRNLMCSTASPIAGSVLSSTQCSTLYGDTSNGVVDRN